MLNRVSDSSFGNFLSSIIIVYHNIFNLLVPLLGSKCKFESIININIVSYIFDVDLEIFEPFVNRDKNEKKINCKAAPPSDARRIAGFGPPGFKPLEVAPVSGNIRSFVFGVDQCMD
uniref:CSON001877 protein n=1 Tax=Culicoides sonorensis TaxID=179676 RepID=A0A336MHN4_CULSO